MKFGSFVLRERLVHLDSELIHFRKQGIGNSISILTEIDEDLAEEFLVVAAYFVVGDFRHNTLVF